VAFLLAGVGYQADAVTPLAGAAIRWSYYGVTVSLIVVQILIVLAWPMDGQHASIREAIRSRTS
jgi:GPH family glycoside/pentoside/hexuronide:cation symporter